MILNRNLWQIDVKQNVLKYSGEVFVKFDRLLVAGLRFVLFQK